MRISDWSSDVCSSDLVGEERDRRDLGLHGPGQLLENADCGRHVVGVERPGDLERDDAGLGWRIGLEGFELLEGAGRDGLPGDRKSVGEGTRVSVRVAIGCRRIIKKKNPNK